MERRRRIWRVLVWLLRPFLKRRFRMEAAPAEVPGPCLIVANHVTNWDPLLLAMSFPATPIRFVASEHIFRHGRVSRLLERLAAPIPRRKASSGADTVKACLRALRDGETVCIFAEGDACWDGLTHEVFPATGKLARSSGAALVTYRLEGGYLTLPRWSKKRRPGRMRGAVVGVYPPEELKAMKGPEITALIDRDIFEDAWARQRAEHVRYRAEDRAVGIEKGFFLCPALFLFLKRFLSGCFSSFPPCPLPALRFLRRVKMDLHNPASDCAAFIGRLFEFLQQFSDFFIIHDLYSFAATRTQRASCPCMPADICLLHVCRICRHAVFLT